MRHMYKFDRPQPHTIPRAAVRSKNPYIDSTPSPSAVVGDVTPSKWASHNIYKDISGSLIVVTKTSAAIPSAPKNAPKPVKTTAPRPPAIELRSHAEKKPTKPVKAVKEKENKSQLPLDDFFKYSRFDLAAAVRSHGCGPTLATPQETVVQEPAPQSALDDYVKYSMFDLAAAVREHGCGPTRATPQDAPTQEPMSEPASDAPELPVVEVCPTYVEAEEEHRACPPVNTLPSIVEEEEEEEPLGSLWSASLFPATDDDAFSLFEDDYRGEVGRTGCPPSCSKFHPQAIPTAAPTPVNTPVSQPYVHTPANHPRPSSSVISSLRAEATAAAPKVLKSLPEISKPTPLAPSSSRRRQLRRRNARKSHEPSSAPKPLLEPTTAAAVAVAAAEAERALDAAKKSSVEQIERVEERAFEPRVSFADVPAPKAKVSARSKPSSNTRAGKPGKATKFFGVLWGKVASK
ncbi:hypothetical protein BOTBODRAFT_172112 [Botryobasidium botryosum FD-172 SS1]|uniref:Uncharacterized protein n=1 Tax=Botryobasidium botryosum (strain FD-172 SS1) TaxID=930990 RepID=A0A067MQ24_BOTB1|nr:hypothetical protein BOTBODRAFT_172112 [Botryobasidium botryosum FD-172 SS1]